MDNKRFKPFSKLGKAEKLEEAKRLFEQAASADTKFQSRARQAYKFYAGDHYTREELHLLKKAGRPALVANVIKPTIELVKGVNEQSRVESHAEPTEKNDGFLCDVLNDIDAKITDMMEIDQQEDDALENMAITGRGFCGIDVEPDPKRPGEIRIKEISIPPSEIRLDPSGKNDDLSDHRRIFWQKWVTLEDFAIRYPEAVKDIEEIMDDESMGDYGTFEIEDEEDADFPVDTPDDEDYTQMLDTGYYDKGKGHIRVVHMEYWDVYDRYYGVNPQTGQLEEFDKTKLKALQQAIPGFQFEKVKDKKVKWFQFTGHKVLFDGDSPIPHDGFSIVAEFAYKDKSKDGVSHFGVVKDMIDPQREMNKRWSQTLNLYLKQSQGGNFVEQSAILDEKEWRDTINSPGEDTVVADGAISGNKIQPKGIPQLPTGSFQLHELDHDLVKKVSGVNPDLLGIQGKGTEPGVVIRLRQQQGLTILSKLFKNHHNMQKQMAKRRFAIVMKYMPDSQIQRILGSKETYQFRGGIIADLKNKIIAPIRNLRDLKYNVSVTESPANMTRRMAQLAVFMDMMGKGFPVDPKVVVDHLDLPESDKLEWKDFIDKSQQMRSKMAQTEMQMKAKAEQDKIQLEAMKLQTKAQNDAQTIAVDMKQLEQKELDDRRQFMVALSKLDQEGKKLVMDMISRLSQPMQLPQMRMQ